MYDNERAVMAYSDMVYRIVLLRLGDTSSADDAYQNTFLKWLKYAPEFDSTEHEKAWFIRCAINCANDVLRESKRRRLTALDECVGDIEPRYGEPEYSGIFDTLRLLDEKYSTPLYLHYVEGYDCKELAKILRITVSGAKMRLKRGRDLLLEAYTKQTADENAPKVSERRNNTNEIPT